MNKHSRWPWSKQSKLVIKPRGFALMMTIVLGLSLVLSETHPAQAGVFDGLKPDRGGGRASNRQRGGAVRGGTCGSTQYADSILALLPDNLNQLKTLEAYPTFFAYLPIARSSDVNTAELLLIAEQEIGDTQPALTRIKLELPERPGIVSIKLPSSAPSLVTDRRYYWRLTVTCDSIDTFRNPFASGWIERVSPNPVLKTSLDRASEDNKLAIFVKGQIWYDGLAQLARKPIANSAEWKELLALFELDVNSAAKNDVQLLMVIDAKTQ